MQINLFVCWLWAGNLDFSLLSAHINILKEQFKIALSNLLLREQMLWVGWKVCVLSPLGLLGTPPWKTESVVCAFAAEATIPSFLSKTSGTTEQLFC